MALFREAASVDPRADLAWEQRSILTAPPSYPLPSFISPPPPRAAVPTLTRST